MFDCVVMNPPYQDDTKTKGSNGRKQSSSKVWPKFITKSFNAAHNVACICPSSALKGTKLRGERFMDRVNKGNIHQIVIGDKSWFDNVATRNIYFIGSNKSKTDVKINNKLYNVKDLPTFIPVKNIDVSLNIVLKVLGWSKNKMFSDGSAGIKGVKDIPFWTDGDKLWVGGGEGSKEAIYKQCNIDDAQKRFKGVRKVCMPLGGGDKPHFIWDDKGDVVCGTSSYVYPLKDEDTFEGVKSYLLSPIVKYILSYLRFDGYLNHAVHELPIIDLSKTWGEDLYKLFNLTDEEISEIKKHV